jgi:predicted porin
MKKSLFALAALATLAGAASAQSSVTLSGSVDLGIVRDETATSKWTMRGAASSRNAITFAGVEDLGGGLKAGFLLNHRFDLGTGNNNNASVGSTSATTLWRQGWLSMAGGFGDVRLGKMLPPLQDFNGGFEPWEGGDTVGSVHTGGAGAGANDSRYAKAAYYRSPVLGGLQLHAMLAAGESQGTVANNAERPIGLGLRYDGGPLSVAVAYDKNQDDLKSTGFYGKYNMGFATAMFQYERLEAPLAATDDTAKRWSVSALVPMGAANFKVGYTSWKDEEIKKFGIGLDYFLSKRTRLYTDLGKLSGDAPTDTQKKTKFDVGVQHRF